MIKVLNSTIEKNKKLRALEIVLLFVLIVGVASSAILGSSRIHSNYGSVTFVESLELYRDYELEDYDESYSVCDVTYVNEDDVLVVTYSYEDYEQLEDESIIGYKYACDNDVILLFEHQNVSEQEVNNAYKQYMANETMGVFNLCSALAILSISLAVVLLFSACFTTYEKCWFLSIMVLATIFAIIFPEESANGVNGIIIMLLYLLDTFLNILCELLISKQSRYNFLVSILVEITEIVICLVLMYRFATMAVTLFFWLPIDIISYINWSKHKDDDKEELTVVRRLKGYQEVLVIVGIIVWTAVVGYLISGIDIKTDFITNKTLETIIIYIDAMASAVGVANGLFIFFRLREQWIAWYICAILEAIINIMSGQYVLLVLKLGYFTNTTYGYIKWSKYIKTHKESVQSLF